MNSNLLKKSSLVIAMSSFFLCSVAPVLAASAPTISLTPEAHNRDYVDVGRRVASSNSGKFLSVWSSKNDKDAAKTGIYGRYSGVAKAFRIQETAPPEALSLSMNDKQAVVAWVADRQVYAQPIAAGTTANIAAEPVFVGSSDADSTVSVATAASGDGAFAVVWRKGSIVWLRQFDKSGVAIADAQQVTSNCQTEKSTVDLEDVANSTSPPKSKPSSEALPCTPDVAMNSAGDTVVVVWDENSNIYARSFKNGDAQNRVDVDATPADIISGKKLVDYSPLTPVVAINQAGDFVVAWSLERASSTVKAAKVCFAKKDCVVETQYVPMLAASIVARGVSKTMTPAAQSFVVVKELVKMDKTPQISMDASGNFALVWSNVFLAKENVAGLDNLLKEKSNVEAQKFSTDARGRIKGRAKVAVQKATRMVGSPLNQSPSVALAKDGSFLVVWDAGRFATPLSSSTNSAFFDVKQRFYVK